MMDKLARMRPAGALVPFMSGFAAELERSGYRPNAAYAQLRLAAGLGRWLDGQGLALSEFTDEQQEAFLAARRAAGYRQWLSGKALTPLVAYLRSIQAVPPPAAPPPLSPAEELLDRYRSWLTGERSAAAVTARCYVDLVRVFAAEVVGDDGQVMPVDAAGVIGFMLDCCSRRCDGTAKLTATALRSFLTFLHVEGILPEALASAVPKVARHRLAGLPRGIEAGQVQALLGSCGQGTAVGLRDFAVLTVLSRLGLRVGETAGLHLEDIDWRGGELIVTGKGDRRERMPLPHDVGAAIAAYLEHGRPVPFDGARQVFLRARAPHRALTPRGLDAIVRDAAIRAGMPPITGHRLRHTVAGQLLAAGASLPEIGQVLRHRRQLTTTIYAKVDVNALRSLARPWPGGAS